MNSKRSYSIYLPVAFALVLILGVLGGIYLMRSTMLRHYALFAGSAQKSPVSELIRYIDKNYVDSVDTEKLSEEAITGMLRSLDPHSMYIPASEFSEANDPLLGNFEGIGIQFRIEHDTVMVINTIEGGPSEKVGLLPGDRIVKVDGKNIAGIKIENEAVMKLLKGPKNTKVQVSIYRRGLKKLIDFSITRDVIPTWSIAVAYTPDKTTGYIKLSKFSATTGNELSAALRKFRTDGVNKLILDLRGNSGGYLQEAIAVADEFLPAGKLIVYTQGLHRPKNSAIATAAGNWDRLPVAVLIDEGSASASEIVAGAIQDNDRGTIIGRRSFGKGLVQEQVDLRDGSALRLTVARYYTPTGRCIQKPYDKGTDDYYMEYYHRLGDGELENADSVKMNDSLKYTTPGGKTVFGGGGIMPDVFIPAGYNKSLKFYNASVTQGLLYQFAFDYTDRNRKALTAYRDAASFDNGFRVSPSLISEYVAYASKNGLVSTSAEAAASSKEISRLLKSYIANNLFDEKGFYPIFLKTDEAFLKAKELLSKTK